MLVPDIPACQQRIGSGGFCLSAVSGKGVIEGIKWWGPCQLHPGTRITCYGCFLPDLTEFTS